MGRLPTPLNIDSACWLPPPMHDSLVRLQKTFQLIFDKVADRLPGKVKLMMFDCCPKEESGFNSSKFARRGTKNIYCYFHFKKNWTDRAADYFRRADDGEYRTELMDELDDIVWSDVR
jgi:hypothetical protein